MVFSGKTMTFTSTLPARTRVCVEQRSGRHHSRRGAAGTGCEVFNASWSEAVKEQRVHTSGGHSQSAHAES